MATVHAQVTGGDILEKEAVDIADLKIKMGLPTNYTAYILGEAVSDSHTLEDYDIVTLAVTAKGA